MRWFKNAKKIKSEVNEQEKVKSKRNEKENKPKYIKKVEKEMAQEIKRNYLFSETEKQR